MHQTINGQQIKVTCQHGRVSMNASDYERAKTSSITPIAEGQGWRVFSTR